MGTIKQRRTRSRHGLSLLELAITLPLVLWLIMGVLEYSWMFLKSQQITNAARAGARAGVRVDATSTEVTNSVSAAMTVAGLDGSGYALTINPGDPTTLDPGATLSVTVGVPYANIGLGLPLIPTPTTLQAQTTMAREGESGSDDDEG